jgi:PhnB protein
MWTPWTRALHAGATSTSAPADQCYGDRTAGLKDPVGHPWWSATHQEDVSPEEIATRAEACMQPQP